MTTNTITKKKTRKIRSKTLIKILFLIVLLLICFIGWKYFYPPSKNVDVASLAKNERDIILQKVGAHIVLPTDEQPTLATVSDPDQLKNFPFFTNAQKGDKVIIYTINKKAILYRPDGDKIVEIAPIVTKSNENQNKTTTDKNSTTSQQQ